MGKLKEAIQEGLLKCMVEHDDLEFMSNAIESELLKRYICIPREALGLLKRFKEELLTNPLDILLTIDI